MVNDPSEEQSRNAEATAEEPSSSGSSVSGGARQLLGMKGAETTSSIWKIRLQLMKPVTWIPLIWGVICGAAASGNYQWRLDHVLAAFACMLMSGPLLTGYTQTINDYYDREIDAINEPYRPIPSGAIPLWQVKAQIWILLLAGLGVAEVGGDDLVVHRAAHGVHAVGRIGRLRVGDQAQLVERVDQLRQIVVGRVDPAAIERGVDARHGLESAGDALRGHGGDLVDRRCGLALVTAFGDGHAQLGAALLQEQIEVGAVLLDVMSRDIDGHGETLVSIQVGN